jgi:hypothetical protein
VELGVLVATAFTSVVERTTAIALIVWVAETVMGPE